MTLFISSILTAKAFADEIKTNDKIKDIIFAGRLGEYRYYDMDKVIEAALTLCEKELR